MWKARKTERWARWGICLAGWSLLGAFEPTGALPWVAGFLWGLITLESWRRRRGIPVLTFHSVSPCGEWLRTPGISIPLKSFDRQMKWLARLGYQTLFLDAFCEQRQKGANRARALVLTFDDGYLDAWAGVLSALERYRLKGTVFVSTGWIDTTPGCRPRLPEAPERAVQWRGYLRRDEIAALQASGWVDIQSHGVSHDSIFVSDRVVDFVTPGKTPPWLYWQVHPEHRLSWFTQPAMLPSGYPIFERGDALAERRFVPDRELIAHLCRRARERESPDIDAWKRMLREEVSAWKTRHGRLGVHETEEQRDQRWRQELVESRRDLERILGKPVRHLAWPRTRWHERSEAIARETGYLSTTAGEGDYNTSGDGSRIERLNVGVIGLPVLDACGLVLSVWVFRGHFIWWPALWALGMVGRVARHKYRRRLDRQSDSG